MRDLTAFFFQDAGDTNTFLDCVRNQKGWKKLSAVTVPARESNTYQPIVPVAPLMKYGIISYWIIQIISISICDPVSDNYPQT
jgi:hypothetical protein